MKLLIKNGRIVNADSEIESDILCAEGRIVKIAKHIDDSLADSVLDAAGCYVLPGGIDPHVHMHLPSKTGFSSDDFYTGSKSALFGGTTTIIDFVTPRKEQSLVDALRERKAEAANSLIDYSFHVSPVAWRDTTAEEIKTCITEEGITSFKIYMAYKTSIGLEDEDIIKVMQVVGKNGGILIAHCELGDIIEKNRNRLVAEKHISPVFHPLSRPSDLEAKAVKNLIEMGKKTSCPVYVVHVSTAQSLPFIETALQKGQEVYAETCPQYLLLDDSKYEGNFEEVAPFVMSPPLRKKTDNQGLWDALKSGVIQTIGTDHCPFSLAQKSYGKTDFRKIPNGAGGVEHRIALLYTYGVLKNKIDIKEMVALTSTNAAKIFGLYPQKGVLQVGADADIVIWNPDKESIISSQTHHSQADNTIYEGMPVRGEATYVILRGEVKIDNSVLFEGKKGSFLPRKIK